MIYLGVDPGTSGGFGWILDGVADAVKMPPTERDILILLASCKTKGDIVAVIEKVHSMPAQGVSSTFKFGQNYGGLRMALTAMEIPWETVTPQKWQREFGLIVPRGKKLSKTQKKNLNKAKAQQMFPHMTIIHAIADAVLIAEWCRRKSLGML